MEKFAHLGSPVSAHVIHPHELCREKIGLDFLYPLQTVFVGGYTVFTSVLPCVSVTFFFLNILKNHWWNFVKFCKHIHIYKTSTTNKKGPLLLGVISLCNS